MCEMHAVSFVKFIFLKQLKMCCAILFVDSVCVFNIFRSSVYRINWKMILKFIYNQIDYYQSKSCSWKSISVFYFASVSLSLSFALFNVAFVFDEIYFKYVQLVLCRLLCDNGNVMRTKFHTKFFLSSILFTARWLLVVSKQTILIVTVQKLLRCRLRQRQQRQRYSLTDAMHGIRGVLNNFDWIHSTNFIDRCDNNSTVHMLCWKLHRFSIRFFCFFYSFFFLSLLSSDRISSWQTYIHPRERARKEENKERCCSVCSIANDSIHLYLVRFVLNKFDNEMDWRYWMWN